jgi:hypothetical protein
MQKEEFDIQGPFNNGFPLQVVHVEDDFEDKLGIIDSSTMNVWIEYDYKPTRIPGIYNLQRVTLPEIPKSYGRWKPQFIGGISKTVRRIQTVRCAPDAPGPISLFATHCPSHDDVVAALRRCGDILFVGDAIEDDKFGRCLEVMVYRNEDVDFVAAVLARAGAHPMLEDASCVSKQPIGVERLDRVEKDGLRRGADNWKFLWTPPNWRCPPISWGYLVSNVGDDVPLEDLAQPLRQHVAKKRLNQCEDGEECQYLRSQIPQRRIVSSGLSDMQSKQLVQAFYHLSVERVEDPIMRKALSLVLYRYMVERGYTSRYMGKYQQDALFVGNGNDFRNFPRLSQYYRPQLPDEVINKLCQKDGNLKARGSKGSRSKYVDPSKKYVPKRTLKRTHMDEQKMFD